MSHQVGSRSSFYRGVREGGSVKGRASYEEALARCFWAARDSRLHRPEGDFHYTGRFWLYWAPFELYRPKSAGHLAALRVRREKGKAERVVQKEREQSPLFTTWAEQNAQHQGEEQPTASVEPIVEPERPPIQRGLFG